MKRFIILTILLCLTFSSAYSFTVNSNLTNKGTKEEGIPLELREYGNHNGTDRTPSIQATIEGHYFSIYFNQCIGEVHFELAFASGTIIDSEMLNTPNSVLLYLYSANDYEITITLPNGDEYYGEFTITD